MKLSSLTALSSRAPLIACLAALAALTAGFSTTTARACDWAWGVHATTPEHGATHPANAHVILHGAFALGDLSALIDGAPASLVELATIPGQAFEPGGRLLALEPAPAPGQVIAITYPSEVLDPRRPVHARVHRRPPR